MASVNKLILVILILLVAGGGALWVWNQQNAADTTEDETTTVERRDIDYTLRISGEISPAVEIEIKPEVGGRVKQIHVSTGQEVSKGQLIAEIDDTELLTEKASAETEIEGAQLRVDLARGNFERSQNLFESNLISREIFDNIQSELDIALNSLTKAERSLQTVMDRIRKTQVTAPTNGTVLGINVIEGQVVVAAASVNNGTTLMTVADLSTLVINSHLNQIDIAHIEAGKQMSFFSDTFPDMQSSATIDFIAPVATIVKAVKGFAVEALVHEPDQRLRPGMTVTLDIPVANANDALSIPISAIFTERDNTQVVYVRQGTSTVKREVKVGITDYFYAEVISGLEPGDEILVAKPSQSS